MPGGDADFFVISLAARKGTTMIAVSPRPASFLRLSVAIIDRSNSIRPLSSKWRNRYTNYRLRPASPRENGKAEAEVIPLRAEKLRGRESIFASSRRDVNSASHSSPDKNKNLAQKKNNKKNDGI